MWIWTVGWWLVGILSVLVVWLKSDYCNLYSSRFGFFRVLWIGYRIWWYFLYCSWDMWCGVCAWKYARCCYYKKTSKIMLITTRELEKDHHSRIGRIWCETPVDWKCSWYSYHSGTGNEEWVSGWMRLGGSWEWKVGGIFEIRGWVWLGISVNRL